MNKEIKRMTTIIGNVKPFYVETIAEALYNAGYRKVPNGAVILTPQERDDEIKACNENQAEYEAEIERLKEKCEELRNEKWDAQDDLDCYCDEMTTRINQAVKKFADEIKAKLNAIF